MNLSRFGSQPQAERVERCGDLTLGLLRHNVDNKQFAAGLEGAMNLSEQVSIAVSRFDMRDIGNDRQIELVGTRSAS